jgi:N-acetylglutamate synthase
MLTIREMNISDYESVIELWSQTESMSLREADSKQSIDRYLARNLGLSFVALIDSVLVGAVLVGTDGRRGYLQHLAVALSHRGEGIGKVLVARSIEALSRVGIDKTHLFVHDNNHNAQSFYLKSGWFERDDIKMFSYNNSFDSNI